MFKFNSFRPIWTGGEEKLFLPYYTPGEEKTLFRHGLSLWKKPFFSRRVKKIIANYFLMLIKNVVVFSQTYLILLLLSFIFRRFKRSLVLA
jgi:hypothetical protein